MDKRLKELVQQAKQSNPNRIWDDAELERFAELLRQDEANGMRETYMKMIHGAVAEEREACAKLLDDFAKTEMVPAKDTWRVGVMAAANAVRDKK
jgi:hypothetical protein